MGIAQFIKGHKDYCRVIYFREGYSFITSNLPVADSCTLLKDGEEVKKAWGHSPKALLPVEGKDQMVQLVNARSGNPIDVFNKVDSKELFSVGTIKTKAIDQHFRAVNVSTGTPLSKLQMWVMAIGMFEFLVAGLMFAKNTLY